MAKLPIDLEECTSCFSDYIFSTNEMNLASKQMVLMYNEVNKNINDPNTWDEKTKNNYVRVYFNRPMKKSYQKKILVKIYRNCVSNGLIKVDKQFESFIRAKSIRSNSGVVNLTLVLESGKFSCKNNCFYCPNDTTTIVPKISNKEQKDKFLKVGISITNLQKMTDEERKSKYGEDFEWHKGISRSYLLGEPAVDRGAQNGWDCGLQFTSRCDQLDDMGHDIDKLEVIFEGGTVDAYPIEYIEKFTRDLYYNANTYMSVRRDPLCIEDEILINESSSHGVIGLTLETRPDSVCMKTLQFYRRLGVTRIQIGAQSIFDNILNNVNRDCTTNSAMLANKRLKVNGFKVDNHWMPDLPGSTFEVDMLMARWLCMQPIDFESISNECKTIIGDQGMKILQSKNTHLRSNQWKWYPTMVLPFTEIKKWHDKAKELGATKTDLSQGIYVPYGTDIGKAEELIKFVTTHCPYDIRINRIVRDFSKKDITGGVDRLSMRGDITNEVKSEGGLETDIRAREVKGKFIDIKDSKIFIDEYEACDGSEYFISLESSKRDILYGFCRLRFNGGENPNQFVFFECLKQREPSKTYPNGVRVAMIIELHVYGSLIAKGLDNVTSKTQHLGIGKFLMYIAECISINKGYNRMSVIAGIGTRNYYRKLGYYLEETYMLKSLTYKNIRCPPLWIEKSPWYSSNKSKYVACFCIFGFALSVIIGRKYFLSS
jgi:histone acetyltransferase (RNA polymerase elongator complex component)